MISVVIPAYNEEKIIGQCLEALRLQRTRHDFEVILVDNASSDRTVATAEAYKHRLRLRIVEEQRKGRGPARHAGFHIAKGDIILSTDADTIVPVDWIEKVVDHFEDPHTIAVTGIFKVTDCSRLKNHVLNFIQPMTMEIYNLVFGHYWLSGFNFAIRKDIYEKAGEFNTDLNGMEDVDLSFRVSKMGKITCMHDLPVICSGRRFQHGINSGLFSYSYAYISLFLFNRGKGYTNDIR